MNHLSEQPTFNRFHGENNCRCSKHAYPLVYFKVIANSTAGQDTQAVWFSMLETGFSLIAVNLPSLWGMVSRASVDSILRSIRSLLSSHRQSSNATSRRFAGLGYDFSMRRSSNVGTQNVELVPQGGSAEFQTVATWEFEESDGMSNKRKETDLESGIRVQKSVGQRETRYHAM